MTLIEETGQIRLEKPEAVHAGPDHVENQEAVEEKASSSQSLITGSRGGLLLGLAFATGLLLGWIVIGWWLWPVKWSNSEPWLLRPELQRTYVELVAEDYWHTQDLSRAREALNGWEEEDLTEVLSTLQAQTLTPETRQQVAALAQALALPDPNESLLTSLLSQKTLVLSAVLSASPLLAAIVLGAFPLVKGRTKKPKELDLLGRGVEELEEELDGLLSEEEGRRPQTVGEDRGTPTTDDRKGQGDEETGSGEAEGEKEGLEEGGASEELEERIGEEDGKTEGDEWLDEEVGEEGKTIGDIFADVFQEEDETFADLEALCKDLPDVDVEDLAQKTEQTIDQLIRSNWLRDE